MDSVLRATFRAFPCAAAVFLVFATPIAAGVELANGQPLAADSISAFGSVAGRLPAAQTVPSRASFLSSQEIATQANLPYTIVGIGAQKCGTTFLWKVLRQHPDVYSDRKETRWFSNPGQSHCKYHPRALGSSDFAIQSGPGHRCTSVVPKGVKKSMYQRYIDKCFCGRWPQGNETILDVSPGYSRKEHKRAIHNMKKMQDDSVLRFIMVLRDPVDRLISEFRMKRKNGVVDVGDDELVRRMGHNVDNIGAGTVKGEYHEAISRWLFHFGKSSLLVINMAELNNLETWQRIFQHAGLRALPNATVTEMLEVANREYKAKQRRKRAIRPWTKRLEVPEWMKDKLAAHYAPFNEKLWTLLGTRWW